MLAADDKYLPYVPCNFAQLARFGRHAEGVVVVVPAGADGNQIRKIEAAAGLHNLTVDVVPIPELDSLRSSGMVSDARHISYFTYARLLFAEILPQLDDVLYLDVDTMVRGPLDGLLSWDLCRPIGAVQQLNHKDRSIFRTSRVPYFNAGVLRMSLERLRQERLWGQAQEIMNTRNDLTYQDQDILNLLFINRFDSLPLTYNVFHRMAENHSDLVIMQDPVIVHFTGPVKPWSPATADPASDFAFAREWRREYSAYAVATSPKFPDAAHKVPDSDCRTDRKHARALLYETARGMLPQPFRRTAKATAVRMLQSAVVRLEELMTKLGAH